MSEDPIDIGKPIDFRWMDKQNRLGAKYENESDRAVALLAASFLEEQIKEALLSIFVEDKQVIDPLVSGYGPLSTFRAYIDIVYALGHIPKELHTELHLVKRIRNHFAHHPDVTDFNTQKVKDWCRELSTPTRLLEDKNTELDARTRFLWAVSNCVGDIRMRLQAVPRPTVPPAPSDL
jgi:DNA-binding MltR family transcriptional regulator